MRKLVGFACFILSSLIIVAVIITDISIFESFFENLEADQLLVSIGLLVALVWDMIYEPLVILLLSVIAMGKFSK